MRIATKVAPFMSLFELSVGFVLSLSWKTVEFFQEREFELNIILFSHLVDRFLRKDRVGGRA
jgi:hypothetical protein